MKRIYLIPTTISENGTSQIPQDTINQVHKIKFFIVERVRTTRRFIKSIIPDFDINSAEFIELDKGQDQLHNPEITRLFNTGEDIGILSESGTPGVADPGSDVVRSALIHGYIPIPLVGPSSIIMALSASGLNGQHFTFHGYLPIKENELNKKLKTMSIEIRKSNATQIFIETPYRNDRLFSYLKSSLSKDIMLCIAKDIGGDDQFINTKSIAVWKSLDMTIGKIPTIFLIGQ